MKRYFWRTLECTRTCSPYVAARINVGHHDLPLHVQEDFSTLAFVHKGTGRKIVGQQRYQLRPRSVYVIHPNIPHAYEETSGLVVSNFCFTPDIWLHLPAALQSFVGFQALFNIEPALRSRRNYPAQVRLDEMHFNRLIELVEGIIKMDGSVHSHHLILMCRITELMAELATTYEEANKNQFKSSTPLTLSRVVIWMENNLSKSVGNKEIAEVASLSIRTVHRLFKDVYGISPTAFLNSLRLKRASSMLKNTSKSINEISRECGFPDANYFARRFRLTYGCQPRELRSSKRWKKEKRGGEIQGD